MTTAQTFSKMKKVKFAFVILHYQVLQMTYECISMLFDTFDMKDNFAVIVDNGSPNGSGKVLQEKYKDNEKVAVVLSKENLGFANGNNLGVRYVRENFDCDFLIVMNNDILIHQKNFLQKVQEIYGKTSFDVLGPDIYNPNSNTHQNPFRLEMLSIQQIEEKQKFIKKRLKFYWFYVAKSLLSKIKNRNRIIPHRISKYDYTKDYFNPVLHGSFLILSEKFFAKRKNVFHPGTFMFFEEDIFFRLCMEQNQTLFYSHELQVNHLEDVSTDSTFKSEHKKQIWKYREMSKSVKVLLNLYKSTQKSTTQ